MKEKEKANNDFKSNLLFAHDIGNFIISSHTVQSTECFMMRIDVTEANMVECENIILLFILPNDRR